MKKLKFLSFHNSSNYNYITTGYGVELYDTKTKSHKKNLFSTFDVAFENLISNILPTMLEIW